MTEETRRQLKIVQPLELGIVLDKSDSMEPHTQTVLRGFNHLISEQLKLGPNVSTSLIQFGSFVDVSFDNEPLDQVPTLSLVNYQVQGATALLDGIGEMLSNVSKRFDLAEVDTLKVLIAIISDGGENASRIWQLSEIREEINYRRLQSGWEFIYLALGAEAEHYALKLSIPKANIIQIGSDEEFEVKLLKFSSAVERLRLGYTDYLKLMF